MAGPDSQPRLAPASHTTCVRFHALLPLCLPRPLSGSSAPLFILSTSICLESYLLGSFSSLFPSLIRCPFSVSPADSIHTLWHLPDYTVRVDCTMTSPSLVFLKMQFMDSLLQSHVGSLFKIQLFLGPILDPPTQN